MQFTLDQKPVCPVTNHNKTGAEKINTNQRGTSESTTLINEKMNDLEKIENTLQVTFIHLYFSNLIIMGKEYFPQASILC